MFGVHADMELVSVLKAHVVPDMCARGCFCQDGRVSSAQTKCAAAKKILKAKFRRLDSLQAT